MAIEIKGLTEEEHYEFERFIKSRNSLLNKMESINSARNHFSGIKIDGPTYCINYNLYLHADSVFVQDFLSALERLKGRLHEQLDVITLTLEAGHEPGSDRSD